MASHSRLVLRIAKWLVAMGFAGVTAGALVTGGLYLYLEPRLPPIELLQDVHLQEPLRIYASSGELMRVYGAKRRVPLEVAEIPQRMQNAFIAAEDNRFYEHPGVDWMGIVRAAWNLVLTGEKGQGGSTITMQVARNFFLSREKTYLRKINEIFLALKIEREISKQEILELYLNKIYLGERAYGVGAAARAYYGKPVDELTLPQMAMIAGLPKAPSAYNPTVDPERALQRRNYVLRRMRDNGMISAAELDQALAAPVTAGHHAPPVELDASYAAEMARLKAVERFGDDAYTGGYSVYTTIVGDEQRAASRAQRDDLIAYEARHGYDGPLGFVDARRLPDLETLRRRVAPVDGKATGEGSDDGAAAAVGQPASELAPGMLGAGQLDLVLSRKYDGVGHLQPAVVVDVAEEQVVVYREGRRLNPISWESMKWAGHDGPADALTRGDVIYVAPGPGERVRLAQEPGVEGAFVALDPHDGAIRALVGGFDFNRSKFNRVTQARRQPGSNFKPFVYSAAINKGLTTATLINDAPVVFDDPALEDTWRPENYSGRVFGPTRLREGLVHSRNLVSIRILLQIGVPYAVDYVQRFGFDEDQLPHNLTLALGSAAVSPLQVVTGYATFANGGFKVEPYLITRIANGAGEQTYRANPAIVCPEPCELRHESESPPAIDALTTTAAGVDMQSRAASTSGLDASERPAESAAAEDAMGEPTREPRFAQRVISERNAYIIRDMLRDVARRGTGQGTRVLGRDDIGGKTGTTDNQVDAWFSGFTSSIVATGWVGYDHLEPLGRYETGARAALPMWIDFMRVALQGTPEVWPELPPGMVTVRIDPDTGEYAGPGVEDAIFEIFRREYAPEPTATARRGDGPASGDGGARSAPLF